MTSKAIFIGGIGRSGTTLMMQLLDKHSEIASFGELQLIGDPIFRNYPSWIYECPHKYRADLIKIFKQLCLTRYFRHRVYWRINPYLLVMRNGFEYIWLSRFKSPKSLLWKNPIWVWLEKLWLSDSIQQGTFGLKIPKHLKAQEELGLRGLYGFFNKKDIKESFTFLDRLKDVATLGDAHRSYGNFWNAVFSNYARKQNKRYWAEKTPDNVLYADFFERCFDNLKMINVIRDGRDVAFSNVSQNWGEDTLKNALDKWASQSVEILSLQEKMSKNQYINVRYEDIVLRTRPTLHRLTDFLEIDFDEAMLTHKLYSGSIGRYEDVWTPELKAYTRDRYGALLDQLGYSV